MDFYPWIVFLHATGVLLFFIAHGTSMAVGFRLKRERDPARVRALLDLSSWTLGVWPSIAFVVGLVAGIAAGIMRGLVRPGLDLDRDRALDDRGGRNDTDGCRSPERHSYRGRDTRDQPVQPEAAGGAAGR